MSASSGTDGTDASAVDSYPEDSDDNPLTLSMPVFNRADLPPPPEKLDRDAIRQLEVELLGSERTLRRREVASGAGVSLLSARKLWRAMGFPNIGDDDVAFTAKDMKALTTIIELVRKEQLTESAAISLMATRSPRLISVLTTTASESLSKP